MSDTRLSRACSRRRAAARGGRLLGHPPRTPLEAIMGGGPRRRRCLFRSLSLSLSLSLSICLSLYPSLSHTHCLPPSLARSLSRSLSLSRSRSLCLSLSLSLSLSLARARVRSLSRSDPPPPPPSLVSPPLSASRWRDKAEVVPCSVQPCLALVDLLLHMEILMNCQLGSMKFPT